MSSTDPLQSVARVIDRHRARLLGIHGRRLSREELEDCYSQASVELLLRARQGRAFASEQHIARAFEQRLVSRIHDRRRALGGRSPIEAALACALPLADCEQEATHLQLVDDRADVERIALQRLELRRIVRLTHELSGDQRLLLASQLAGERPSAFCARHGWTLEKYRKVGQRARVRLSLLGGSPLPVAAGSPRQAAGAGL